MPDARGQGAASLHAIDVLQRADDVPRAEGLYVLEAGRTASRWCSRGTGRSRRLIEATGGGLLVPPDDPAALAAGCGRC